MSKSIRTCSGVTPPNHAEISEFLDSIRTGLTEYAGFVNANHRPVVGFTESSFHQMVSGEIVQIQGEPILMTDDEFATYLRDAKFDGKLVGQFIEKGQRKANGQSLAVNAWGTDEQDVIAEIGIYEGHAGYDPMVIVKWFYRDENGIVRHVDDGAEIVTRPCGCVQKVRDYFGHFSDSTPEAVIDFMWSILAKPNYYGVLASQGGKAVADQHQADPNFETSIHEESRPDNSHWLPKQWGGKNRPF